MKKKKSDAEIIKDLRGQVRQQKRDIAFLLATVERLQNPPKDNRIIVRYALPSRPNRPVSRAYI